MEYEPGFCISYQFDCPWIDPTTEDIFITSPFLEVCGSFIWIKIGKSLLADSLSMELAQVSGSRKPLN